MADWETIQDRNVSGKGVLKLPTDVVKNRAYVLFVTVIRMPKNKYANFGWNPYRSRFANLVFLRDGYVLESLPMEFEKQVYDGVNDICGQGLIAIKCMYAGVLQTFVNLAVGLSQTPGGLGLLVADVEDKIKDFESLRFQWDEVRVQCYADTGINLRLDRLIYDTCTLDTPKDRPPPPPPAPRPQIPPGQPITDISHPYTPDANQPYNGDEGNTQPFPTDIPALPPEPEKLGVECTIYDIQFEVQTTNQTYEYTGRCFGKFIPEVFIDPDNASYLSIRCQGGIESNTCGAFGVYHIFSNGRPTLVAGRYISSNPPT